MVFVCRDVPRLGLSHAEKLCQAGEMLGQDREALRSLQEQLARRHIEVGTLNQQCNQAQIAHDMARANRASTAGSMFDLTQATSAGFQHQSTL